MTENEEIAVYIERIEALELEVACLKAGIRSEMSGDAALLCAPLMAAGMSAEEAAGTVAGKYPWMAGTEWNGGRARKPVFGGGRTGGGSALDEVRKVMERV